MDNNDERRFGIADESSPEAPLARLMLSLRGMQTSPAKESHDQFIHACRSSWSWAMADPDSALGFGRRLASAAAASEAEALLAGLCLLGAEAARGRKPFDALVESSMEYDDEGGYNRSFETRAARDSSWLGFANGWEPTQAELVCMERAFSEIIDLADFAELDGEASLCDGLELAIEHAPEFECWPTRPAAAQSSGRALAALDEALCLRELDASIAPPSRRSSRSSSV